jgi:hypothetical protein
MAAAVGWAAALPLAAWMVARPGTSPLYAFALAVYGVGGLVCHQLPERSFHPWSAQMPVCARCAGIYIGGAIAAIIAPIAAAPLKGRPTSNFGSSVERCFSGSVGRRFSDSVGRRVRGFVGRRVRGFVGRHVRGFVGRRVCGFVGRRFSGARATLIVAALPTIATLLYEWTTGQMPPNWIRALAGVPIGWAVAWVIMRQQ